MTNNTQFMDKAWSMHCEDDTRTITDKLNM